MQVRESQAPSLIGDSHFSRVLNIYYRKDSSILPYMCWSSLFTVLSFGGLFLYENNFHVDSKIQQRQLIDIEFVSNADFQNKHELLPSTIPKPSVGKNTSPVMQSKGELFAPPVFVIRQANNKAAQLRENQMERNEPKQKEVMNQNPNAVNHNDLASRYLPLSAPFPVIPLKQSRSNLLKQQTDKPETTVELDEVSPPELMEIKENDGDNSNNIWQDGGHSVHGLGAASVIAEYLKDLHRKLKHHWAPPSGTVRHIEIVFRLSRDGHLVSMKLTRSSGNKSADDSAMAAIKEAAPFGKLPEDYPHQFLDLAYNFNYTADELTEVHTATALDNKN